MNTAIVKLDATQFGVEKSRAKEMESAFVPMINRLKEMEVLHGAIIRRAEKGITEQVCTSAHTLRLQYVKSRTGVDAVHKAGKQEVLLLGRAWDGLKNQYLYVTNQKEEALQKIEKHFEIIEAERKEKLKTQREKMLAKYEIDTEYIQLGEMTEEVWVNYFNGIKLNYENVKAAEKKAEEERLKAEKITKLHNDRKNSILNLWQFAEPELKTANLGEIDDKEWSNIVKSLDQEKADYDAGQEAIRKENERLQKEAEAKEKEIKKQTEATAKVEAQLQAKKDAEAEAEEAKQAAIEAELSRGDKEKFQSLITDLSQLQGKYTFKSKKYQNLQASVNELLDKTINFIKSKN